MALRRACGSRALNSECYNRVDVPEETMADERWQKIQTLYHRARALSSSERATFLEEACASDADLRSEVEAMLSADGKAGSLLEASPLGMNAQVLMPLSAGTRL